jgi:hypothetical protein
MSFDLIAALIVTHLVGDFLLQPRWMASNKSSKVLPWLSHVVVIIVSLIPCTYFFSLPAMLPLYYGLLHGAQDALIWKAYKYYFSRRTTQINWYEDYWFYTTIGLDQALHLLTLMYLISILSL